MVSQAERGQATPLWQRAALLSLGFFLCAWLGRFISDGGGTAVNFWLPGGLFVAVLLVNPTRDWPWLMLAIFPANILFDLLHDPHPSFWVIAFFCVANLLQSGLGAWLVRRFVAEKPALATLKEFSGLLFFAGVVGSALGATLATTMLTAFHLADAFVPTWKFLWGGNLMAVLVLAPFILKWFARGDELRPRPLTLWRVLEAVGLFGGMLALTWYVFCPAAGISAHKFPVLIFMLWAGLRFRVRGAAAAVFLLAVTAAFLTSQSLKGHAASEISAGDYAFTLQVFIAVAAMMALAPAIVLDERNRTMRSLRESEEKFSKAFYSSPDAISISDLATGEFIEVNEGFPKIYGYTREEIIGRTATDLGMWGAERDRVELIRRLAADRMVRHYDGLGRRRSGELFPNLFNAELVTIKGRVCLISVVHDMTAQKRAEALVAAQMRVLEMLAAGKPMRETLAALLQLMEAQAPDTLCSILLLDADGIHMRHGAAPSLPPEFIRAVDGMSIGPCVGSCGTASFRRAPVLVADIASDPLWADYKKLALPHGLRACWSTPILDAQQKVLGTFAIYRRTPGLPEAAHRQLTEMATHTAAICLGKHRSETEHAQSVAREQQARIHYTFQLIASQEAERKRIAAELHDSMGQNLLLIKNLAQLAARTQEPAQVYDQLNTISQLAAQCIAEARQISRDLHPHQLDHLGLKRSLELMLENAAQASAIKFSWKLDDIGEIFSADDQMNLYRIVQESLNNILKHSRAQNVCVLLERDVHEVVLEITDDGCGFDPAAHAHSKSGMGLKNISERVRMLGGELTMNSAPGNGTRLRAIIPGAGEVA